MFSALITAIVYGIITYLISRVAVLTFSWLKNRLIEKLRKKPGSIKEEAILTIEALLKQSPTIDLASFGRDDITENDILLVGLKDNDEIETNVEVVQARKVDDSLSRYLERNGGVVKVGGLAG